MSVNRPVCCDEFPECSHVLAALEGADGMPHRFDAFTAGELAMLHHALRLLARYENERDAGQLANEAWQSFLARYPDVALASVKSA